METIHEFPFFGLRFDREGKLENEPECIELKKRAAKATDVILIAHGWLTDELDATTLYTSFLETLRMHINGPFENELGPKKRTILVGGVFWPSKTFDAHGHGGGTARGVNSEAEDRQDLVAKLESLKELAPEHHKDLDHAIGLVDETKTNPKAQDDLVKDVMSVLGGSKLDETEGLELFTRQKGSDLIKKLAAPIILPVVKRHPGEGGVTAIPGGGAADQGQTQSVRSFFGTVFGRIGQILNVTTWYVMKERAGVVGAADVACIAIELEKLPGLRLHLVGHSLGGRLMAACAKVLAAQKVQADSLMLLEAAFSHYGFSANNGKGIAGFFRDVVSGSAVKGPFLVTHSMKDTVVGHAYALASRLAGDNTAAFGDENDEFGGIGRNGAQKIDAVFEALRVSGSPRYEFKPSTVYNLDGSADLIKHHGDVTNLDVTFALACALAQT